MPANTIRRKNGNKVYNKNTTGRRGIWLPDGSRHILPSPRTHTSPVIRTPENDGHDNPTRLRHQATRERHREA